METPANDVLLTCARQFGERVRDRLGDEVLDLRLFGSAARGEAHEDSDVDVFVLLRDDGWAKRRELLNLAGDLWRETGVLVSPFVLGRSQFEEWRRQDRPLLRDVLREGIPT